MESFDAELQIYKRSGRHVKKSSAEDLKKVVKELVDNALILVITSWQLNYQEFNIVLKSLIILL